MTQDFKGGGESGCIISAQFCSAGADVSIFNTRLNEIVLVGVIVIFGLSQVTPDVAKTQLHPLETEMTGVISVKEPSVTLSWIVSGPLKVDVPVFVTVI